MTAGGPLSKKWQRNDGVRVLTLFSTTVGWSAAITNSRAEEKKKTCDEQPHRRQLCACAAARPRRQRAIHFHGGKIRRLVNVLLAILSALSWARSLLQSSRSGFGRRSWSASWRVWREVGGPSILLCFELVRWFVCHAGCRVGTDCERPSVRSNARSPTLTPTSLFLSRSRACSRSKLRRAVLTQENLPLPLQTTILGSKTHSMAQGQKEGATLQRDRSWPNTCIRVFYSWPFRCLCA